MEKIPFEELVVEQLEKATSAPSGRSSQTLYGGHEHRLRQTIIALSKGEGLDEHASPGEATLLVLQGRVTFNVGSDSIDLEKGDYFIIPPELHSVDAVDDSVILLSVSLPK